MPGILLEIIERKHISIENYFDCETGNTWMPLNTCTTYLFAFVIPKQSDPNRFRRIQTRKIYKEKSEQFRKPTMQCNCWQDCYHGCISIWDYVNMGTFDLFRHEHDLKWVYDEIKHLHSVNSETIEVTLNVYFAKSDYGENFHGVC